MLVLLAGIFVVHIATVVMLFVSTIANVSSTSLPMLLFPGIVQRWTAFLQLRVTSYGLPHGGCRMGECKIVMEWPKDNTKQVLSFCLFFSATLTITPKLQHFKGTNRVTRMSLTPLHCECCTFSCQQGSKTQRKAIWFPLVTHLKIQTKIHTTPKPCLIRAEY